MNYLEKIPQKNPYVCWQKDAIGFVTIEIENTGLVNRFFQKIFKKPKISYIHLDDVGSKVWTLIDGEKNIFLIGQKISKTKGQDYLYERLSKYMDLLEGYKFIKFK